MGHRSQPVGQGPLYDEGPGVVGLNGGGMSKRISKVVSQPLLQFLVLGAIVYAFWVWI